MDLPEISAMVALHLCRHIPPKETRHDLTVCARVCKDWHAIFTPLLYRSIPITIRSTDASYNEGPAPSPEVLQANCHLVQELSLTIFSTHSPVLQQATVSLRNLTKLNLIAYTERRDGGPTGIDWLSLRPLMVNNRRIQELSLDRITDFDCLSHIAENCTSHLTTLHLRNMQFDWNQLRLLLTNCRQLSKLECDTCRFLGSKVQFMEEVTTTSWPTTHNIKDLQLHQFPGLENATLVEWVKICPRLATLSVAKASRPWLGSISQFSPGPQLSSLELDCDRLEDAELTEILTRCTSLRNVALGGASLTGQVFSALSRHFDSLVCLNVIKLPIIAQWTIRRIFEGCRRLEAFCLSDLDVNSLYNAASDNQEDLPWACHDSLKELCILNIKMSSDASINCQFMKRLMDLKQLEHLVTMRILRWDEGRGTLKPEHVPGDTPEARLLGKLCECKNWELAGNELKHDPRWRLVRDTWPKLSSFFYNGDPYDDFSCWVLQEYL